MNKFQIKFQIATINQFGTNYTIYFTFNDKTESMTFSSDALRGSKSKVFSTLEGMFHELLVKGLELSRREMDELQLEY